jgi:3-hydroxybutyryl-CoA dehydratase
MPAQPPHEPQRDQPVTMMTSESTSPSSVPAEGLRIPSRRRAVSGAEVEAFVRLTGDLHPIHLDSEWARSSLFGARIAPGMLVLSFSLGLVDLDYEHVVALRRLRNVVFKRPVYFGDVIYVDAIVTGGKLLSEDVTLLELRWIVRNGEDKTVLRASIEVLWRADKPEVSTQTTALKPDPLDDMPPGVVPF